MATLALFAMCGLMGLAVDLGWSYFTEKAAQRAADAAALAAVKAAFSTLTQSGPFACTSNPCSPNAACMVCQATPTPCSSIAAGSNLYNGCQYAAQNGFTSGSNPRQEVRLSADNTSPFVTRTGNVVVHYWTTATVVETIPQLFSAIFGNGTGTVAASATAAIVDITVPGTLILLNRRGDRTAMSSVPGGQTQFGVNLLVQANDNQGQYALQTAGGIRMASDCGPSTPWNATTCSNGGNQNFWAGENQGGGTVSAAQTLIRLQGWYHLAGSSQWIPQPTNGTSSGFGDPMAGKGQPPPNLPSQSWNNPIPVLGGVIAGGICPGGICQPGQYFATRMQSCGQNCQQEVASGAPLEVSGNITFASGPSGFGNYAFYGGMRKASGGATTITFQPGIYTFAGALMGQNSPGILLDTSTNMTLRDNTISTGQNADAGALFIFTNGNYTDANGQPRLPEPNHVAWSRASGLVNDLKYGTVNIQAGNNSTYINLHGLNPSHASIQGTPLETFAPTLFWWDQGNSSVEHDINGNVVTSSSCGGGGTLDTPCPQSPALAHIRSPELALQASPALNLYGTVYQSRGAWTTLIGGGGYSGPIQLITGALQVKANSNVNMVVPENTITITTVSLIE
jgi:Flp pilus assembly protein TadG